MQIPETVQQWIALRERWEQTGEGPRVLPIVQFGDNWYFADDRLREYRNVLDPTDIKEW